MISITTDAKGLFQQVERPEGTVLRLDPMLDEGTGETGVGISAGEPKGDDQVIEHEGDSLLHIDNSVSEALDGSTLNVVDTSEGPGIGIIPPDAEPTA